MSTALFPNSLSLGMPDAWYTSSVAGQLKGTEEVWDGSDIEAAQDADCVAAEDEARIVGDSVKVDATGAPVVIVDAVIPAPTAHVSRKPSHVSLNKWKVVTLSTGKVYGPGEPVPCHEFPTSKLHPDFELVMKHNQYVSNGKKFATSKTRQAAREKAEEEAVCKEREEKAKRDADLARRFTAMQQAAKLAVPKPVVTTAASMELPKKAGAKKAGAKKAGAKKAGAKKKKASSNIFAVLGEDDDDDEEGEDDDDDDDDDE